MSLYNKEGKVVVQAEEILFSFGFSKLFVEQLH